MDLSQRITASQSSGVEDLFIKCLLYLDFIYAFKWAQNYRILNHITTNLIPVLPANFKPQTDRIKKYFPALSFVYEKYQVRQ